MKLVRFLAAAFAVSMAVGTLGPAAATHGAWLAGTGAFEPSTRYDDARHMFQSANQAPRDRVYFNGFVAHSDGIAVPRYDVNVDGGSLVSPGGTYFMAVLGFWRDCNKDGYIGAKVVPANWGNFAAYPRELVEAGAITLDTAVCPAGSAYNPMGSAWIDEFRVIGPGAAWEPYEQAAYAKRCGNPTGVNIALCAIERTDDRYDVTDNASKVWADWGFPGGPHIPHQGLVPQPRGTYSDSDNTLYYVDFALQGPFSGALGDLWTNKPNIGACDEDRVLLGGPDGTCGLWPLYQAKRLLNDSDSATGPDSHPSPLVNVFDTQTDNDGSGSACDDGFATTLPNGKKIAIPEAAPALHPNFLVEGSIGGTYRNIFIGTHGLTAADSFNGQCSAGAPSFTSIEGESNDDAPTHVEPDDKLTFAPDQRIHGLRAYGFDDAPLDALGTRGSTGVGGTPTWYGGVGWTPRPPRTGWGSVVETWATFYADVTTQGITNAGAAASTAFPGGAQNAHRYAVPEMCTTITTGPSNLNGQNWECSITVWQERREAVEDPDAPILGDGYDLRDVDCMDNSIGAGLEGVRLGVAVCNDH